MADQVFSSLGQKTLQISALDAIREKILNGMLRPGQQLIQAEIAAQMEISRAPVREALRQLEEEGLVENIPYKGTFVSKVTKRDIMELYSLRGVLEAFAVRLVISRCTDEDLSSLDQLLQKLALAAATGDVVALNAADVAFHTHICTLSQHRHLLRNWQANFKLIRRILSLRNQLNPHQIVVARHQPIIESIRLRDVSAADAAVMEHCLSSGDALAATWSDEGDDS